MREDEISIFAIGTVLIRHRRRIITWMVLGAFLGFLSVVSKPRLFVAAASFYPQGQTDVARSGLAGLAGQLGVSLPSGNQSLSPDFYVMLLRSRAVLLPIAHDTLTVAEMGGRRVRFYDLFKIRDANPKVREEQAINALRGIISTSVVKVTGVVELRVSTLWPSVSLAIAESLVAGVDAYNQRTRQGQAKSERKFVESRLEIAGANLRRAEESAQYFLSTNRDIGSSAQLMLQRERLQRDVAFNQQLYSSLLQAYEEVRIREVRDTPVITVIEAPSVASKPTGRGARMRVLLGLAIGLFVGLLVSLVAAVVGYRRRAGNADAHEFLGELGAVKGAILKPVSWARRRGPPVPGA